MIRQHIVLRGLVIDPPLLLAPMAGLTHSALRRIIAGFGGVGLLSTEMLSARRLPSDSPRVSPFLIRTEAERPLSHQLLFSSLHEIGPALHALHAAAADAVDLNMGCPAATVGRFGAGVKLMERPDDVRRMVAEVRQRTELPLTAKIRIGADLDLDRLRSFCSMLQDEGIELLSVHARMSHETFDRRPRWEHVAKIKEWLAIPVIANGGIFSVQDAQDCLRISGADGLMIGRAAAITPWLFAEIAREVYGREIVLPQISLPKVYSEFVSHLELYRPQHRLGRLKEFTTYFAGNFQFGHYLATRVRSSATVDEARERAEAFFLQNTGPTAS
jgi:nifR3 family TIM-barrel protein